MKNHWKKIIFVCIPFCILMSTTIFAKDNIKISKANIIFNGTQYSADKSVYLVNNRIFCSAEDFANMIGGQYNSKNSTIGYNKSLLAFTINSSDCKLGDTVLTMSDAITPIMIDDSVYLPIRFVCNDLKINTSWDENSQTVLLSSLQPNTNNDAQDKITGALSLYQMAVNNFYSENNYETDYTTSTLKSRNGQNIRTSVNSDATKVTKSDDIVNMKVVTKAIASNGSATVSTRYFIDDGYSYISEGGVNYKVPATYSDFCKFYKLDCLLDLNNNNVDSVVVQKSTNNTKLIFMLNKMAMDADYQQQLSDFRNDNAYKINQMQCDFGTFCYTVVINNDGSLNSANLKNTNAYRVHLEDNSAQEYDSTIEENFLVKNTGSSTIIIPSDFDSYISK